MASVTLKEVSKKWGDFTAVDNISLEVGDEEFMVLLGPSGCGKTTTMRMVAGLEEPSNGEIFIGEKRVNDELPKDRDVAMVFQNYGLYPHMTVYENIRYPLKVRKVAKQLQEEQVHIAAEKVQLRHLLQRRPRELSGGQRQRVALARAIVRTPTVFLMDEPLSNLDAKLRVNMRAELKHLQHELKITTIYVTHDQIEAMTLADRVAVMHEGVISQLDSPEKIYNDPANLFVAGFIGSPSMNLIPGSLQEGIFHHSEFSLKTARGDHEKCVMGIRPEDLAITSPGDGIFSGQVYSFELTGESTLITLQLGQERIIVRGTKDFRVGIDEKVGIVLNSENCFLFDAETQQRMKF
ncbi:MAG: ABC transporter ATP-binding protein [SAR324 cluster bacterium]|jgi:multiple sugar transport system ATP-binding protein|nr:ABC transporter ATP-binding protein [Pseudomonadota bacterium]MDP6094053.1 ABC transporter ATP-binding protein [SAR324 cluster bacterium]MEE1577270.1 ABC transporter ATP-binding protein [Deltaproteobacteria bacterium]MDP6248125.1 ABC transporter ATP-binding protein [SAR324 cluster bacterium]MDP6465676.1 ABC transporter ATP-binding protein [SAR324 cluster bacterium]|tara:strand:+ start:4037 stop:5089 length:1053 start_codon:yes stop_codon:yes gene_type:complete